MEEVPDFGAVFTFGKSKFGDNNANKFWVKNDPVVCVACGDEHTAVVTTSGRAYTFGSNQWGQLGLCHTNQTNKPSFVKVLKGTPVKLVACGRSHTLIATADSVYGCGGNGEHQICDLNEDEITRPHLIAGLSGLPVKRLSCGVEHSLLLTRDGVVYLWGTGSEGQLGMGPSMTVLLKPTLLKLTDELIKDASAGYYHTGLVTQSGKVFTFGESESGKLGVGEECRESYDVPQPVFLVDTADSISCGNTCTAVRSNSGVLYMAGDGQRGQLGFSPDSLTRCVYTLTKVPCPPISRVTVGEGHTAVVTKSGKLYTFGDGRHGKLCHGDDNFSNLHSPHLVETFSNIATVQDVACGGCHTMVMAKPGTGQNLANKPSNMSEDVGISPARSKRHKIRQDETTDNKENVPNILEENVKSLESIMREPPKKIVELSYVKKEKKEERPVENKEEGDSGSETDEPGATSDVTDSEEDSGGGFPENVMCFEELEPVQMSAAPTTQSAAPTTQSTAPAQPASLSSPRIIKVTSNLTSMTESAPDVNKPLTDKKTTEQSSTTLDTTSTKDTVEDDETETDDEGEDESEEETEEEEETKKDEVKTLVSTVPADPAPQDSTPEPAKTPSKFKFWKKTKKEAPVPETPSNQTSSKACIIL